VERNAGSERQGETFVAQDGWSALAPAEVTAITALPPEGMVRPGEIAFFQIPALLRAAWWKEAECAGAGASPGTHRSLSEIVELLRFKRLPLPDRVSLRVAASLPDLASTRVDGPVPGGLGFGDPPPVASINLGDEASWIVLLPLSPLELAEQLDRAGGSLAEAASPPALAARFLEAFPAEPLLRLRLEPGEGLWFPAEGLLHDGWTRGRTELDVVLQLTADVEMRSPAPEHTPQERMARRT
jgi:hypothetical protein